MIATTPRERPILFSDEMAAAVWDDRKRQTRRMIDVRWDTSKHWGNFECWTYFKNGKPLVGFDTANNGQDTLLGFCPYGKPGDRLWVRESFLPCHGCGLQCRPAEADYVCFRDGAQQYRSGAYHPWPLTTEPNWSKHRFSPSIHLPRWAARSLLEITAVRAELLLSIPHGDAIAEGIASVPQLGVLRACGWKDYSGQSPGFLSPVDSFRSLWQKINGADAWHANQWVWVVSFRKVK